MSRDWHVIEKAYVFGVVAGTRDDGSEIRVFPTIRQIAQQLGIARSVVGNRACRGDWVRRRQQFQAELGEATWKDELDREVARSRRDAD